MPTDGPGGKETTPISRASSEPRTARGRDPSLHARSASGFTLLELIVVILILAVAGAVVFPAVRGGARQREVRQTLQHFVSAVRRASSMAIMKRQTVELRLWPDDGEYALVIPPPPAREDDEDAEAERAADLEEDGRAAKEHEQRFVLPETASFGEIEGGRYTADEDLAVGVGTPQEILSFDFHPTGSSSGGKVELVFEVGRDRQAYKFVINPLVSSISMEDE